MKKLKISDAVGICAACFVLCIGISIIAKKAFDIDSDFLSASATLCAAIIAVRLFIDWREQQRYVLLEKYQELIRESGKSLFLNYSKFHITVKTVRNQYVFPCTKEEEKRFYHLDRMGTGVLVQELLSELFHASTLLHEYTVCLKKLNPDNVKSDHFNDIKYYMKLLLDSYASLSTLEQSPDIEYVFNLAKLVDRPEISTSVQHFKELCGCSCVKFLNDQLIK